MKIALAETQCETIEIVGYLRVKIFDMASIKMNDFEYVYRRQVTVKCTNKYTKKKLTTKYEQFIEYFLLLSCVKSEVIRRLLSSRFRHAIAIVIVSRTRI